MAILKAQFKKGGECMDPNNSNTGNPQDPNEPMGGTQVPNIGNEPSTDYGNTGGTTPEPTMTPDAGTPPAEPAPMPDNSGMGGGMPAPSTPTPTDDNSGMGGGTTPQDTGMENPGGSNGNL